MHNESKPRRRAPHVYKVLYGDEWQRRRRRRRHGRLLATARRRVSELSIREKLQWTPLARARRQRRTRTRARPLRALHANANASNRAGKQQESGNRTLARASSRAASCAACSGRRRS